MKRFVAAAALGLLAVACPQQGSGSQYDYTYEGCAAGGQICPNDETLLCAAGAVVKKHNACTNDSDCVASEVDNKCVAILSCDGPPAVSRDQKGAFETEFNAEYDKYCRQPTCTTRSACAPGPRRNVLVCFEGQCLRAFRPLDAGFPDAGTFIPYDAGTPDAGVDGGTDAGASDAGASDAGFDGGADAGDGGP